MYALLECFTNIMYCARTVYSRTVYSSTIYCTNVLTIVLSYIAVIDDHDQIVSTMSRALFG